jgi:hypothetical protein
MTVNQKVMHQWVPYKARTSMSVPFPHQPLSPCRTHVSKHVSIHGTHFPIPTIDPSESCRVFGIELNIVLSFTKQWQELKRTTTPLINALSTSLLTESLKICVIRGLFTCKHFTLQLRLFMVSQLDVVDRQICVAISLLQLTASTNNMFYSFLFSRCLMSE